MDKREMLKRYVELKVEQPYIDLLGTDWYEGANGLGSAYEKIEELIWQVGYVYAAAKDKSECSLDEIVDVLMLSEEDFNKYYYGE